ncbi:hypothetical protein JT359_04805 [Candidatus Poribacteria bacterium]|nr:hypothetical protein [Candidatus Poribacteria bacterium]
MLKYQLFPRSIGITNQIQDVIGCFEATYDKIESPKNELKSDEVLNLLRPFLEKADFTVETWKSKNQKIPVPVLYGKNNTVDKHFHADGISADGKIVLEVEAGRAYANNAFLKDIFQASLMYDVEYLILAVRNNYKNTNDFDKIYTFLETLYISNRLLLPLKGITLIGY